MTLEQALKEVANLEATIARLTHEARILTERLHTVTAERNQAEYRLAKLRGR